MPDHTKIEAFRSRLSPTTQQQLANELAKVAVALGFAHPECLDIDSTIQEANMAYPSDVHLLVSLSIKAKKVWAYLQDKFSTFTFDPLKVDLTAIKKLARACYFYKGQDKEKQADQLNDLWLAVFKPVMKVVDSLKLLNDYEMKRIPWHLKRLSTQLQEQAYPYFIETTLQTIQKAARPTRALCFHLKEVACFNKGKPGKSYQFGRAFQLGRLAGNFLTVAKSDSVRMDDKNSLQPMVKMHQQLFEDMPSLSVATDKGYYSKKNAVFLQETTGSHQGLQKPVYVKEHMHEDNTELINRRSGIEPLIGHAKHGGQLGKSRMKHDTTTESSGYAAILGFNARQLTRYLTGKAVIQPLPTG